MPSLKRANTLYLSIYPQEEKVFLGLAEKNGLVFLFVRFAFTCFLLLSYHIFTMDIVVSLKQTTQIIDILGLS